METKKEIHLPNLGVEFIKKTILLAWDSYESKFKDYSPVLTWKEPTKAELSFLVGATVVKGNIHVKEEKLIVSFNVPFLLRSFVPEAEKAIIKEVKFWLEKTSYTETPK